jgi:hypothetical protein
MEDSCLRSYEPMIFSCSPGTRGGRGLADRCGQMAQQPWIAQIDSCAHRDVQNEKACACQQWLNSDSAVRLKQPRRDERDGAAGKEHVPVSLFGAAREQRARGFRDSCYVRVGSLRNLPSSSSQLDQYVQLLS